ncbi:MAG: S41 family peptidase [Bacteroidales bacterium]|nr:S41 family peptidase [Bacteroidales bacterium]
MRLKNLIAAALTALISLSAAAQSGSFTMGKWLEIQSAIMKELGVHYVDSLPLERIEKVGIQAMLANLDPYTIYVPEEETENFNMLISNTYGGIGAIIYKPELQGNVIISEPYEGSPSHLAGLQPGDEIMEIDSQTVKGLSVQESTSRMRGVAGTTVKFLVKKVRTGEIKEIQVVRQKIHLPDIRYAGILDDKKTGYIALSGFTYGVSALVQKEVVALKKAGMKELVLDLRGNGGGLLQEAVDIVGLFVPKGTLVVSSRGKGMKDDYNYKTTSTPVDLNLPLVVLVDSQSASASEIVAGALQDLDRATIMGQRTFGKGLVQSIRPMPYGGQLKLTTAKYYIPSGRCVQIKDYAHRREDGSVGNIPDSLTSVFRTMAGREVRDGGGITPDVILPSKNYSRLAYALAGWQVIEHYALDYVKTHESIPPVKDFHFDEYDDFVRFAKDAKFDYRSSAKTYFDAMRDSLKTEAPDEETLQLLEALSKKIDVSKEDALRARKEEIIPLIEEEIVVRYHFQRAAMELRLRYDEELRKALESPRI